MKTIYFVRHGESEANIGNLRSGGFHDIPLTKRGRMQAKEAGLKLKDKKIELIVSSPLERTVDTATIIAKEIGIKPSEIITNSLFVERSFGIYDGKANDEYLAAMSAGTLHESVETTESLHRRISEGLKWLKTLNAERILLVCHGAAGRMVQAVNQELPHHEIHTMKLLENAEIYEFKL